ncbi:MAG: hypothetical protein JWM86_2750 [Thermoleophilia bacterium]|nr:hypothetical protein [Thermoleophilia bacterium]
MQQQPVIQHGHPQGMPPAAVHGGPHGMHPGSAAPAPALGIQPAVTNNRSVGATFVTGAYQASGDPAIDRMVRLEAACKRFGSPI